MHVETLDKDEIKFLSDFRDKMENSNRLEVADEINDIIVGYSKIDEY